MSFFWRFICVIAFDSLRFLIPAGALIFYLSNHSRVHNRTDVLGHTVGVVGQAAGALHTHIGDHLNKLGLSVSCFLLIYPFYEKTY